ncbi:hypothetical protein [Amycolatopsis keratiniphila]|uniref:hypothetical protein n=1 Tax=Amycolatopsis keratiniphila TaxID=129921 RepID=UPI00087D6CDC|nr:hypothetical protein [Amycolatopsis keratiniphila]OLZ61780.1 hypothetical protein BS330_01910 [Amycolatopsis keratiniphila subsp. nogabecina]SDU15644.1 ABC-2 type transport system permease protein [Amycolatopsis keratiniphila]
MVGDLIRLKLTIQRHTLGWKRVLGLVAGVLAAAVTWAVVFVAEPAARTDVLLLVLACWTAGWMIGPVLTSGAAMLRPEYFTLLPLPRRGLGAGLLAAAFAGVGGVVTTIAALALVPYALTEADGTTAIASAATAIVGAALLVVFVVALSRTVYALLGAAMRTHLGVELAAVQYGLLLSSMTAGWAVVRPVLESVPVFLREGFGAIPARTVLEWTPFGLPLRAAGEMGAGRLFPALGSLAILAAATAVVVAAAIALSTPQVGNRTVRRRRRPLGSRVLTRARRLPSSPLGAVVGKELRTWWRDPWRSLEVRSAIWFGVFIAVYGAIAGVPEIAGLAGVAVALTVALSGANLYGQDGTALWQLVVAESPTAVRADVLGRQLGLTVLFGLPALVLSAAMMAVTGIFAYAVPILAVLIALLGVGCGTALLMSVLGATPGVDPHRRVNATDAGENTVGIFAAFQIQLWATAPTSAMAAVLTFAGDSLPTWFGAATIAVALLNAVAGAWLGGVLATRRLAARLPETFAKLR